MRFLAGLSLLLVLVLVVLSAYLRLFHSGIGCPDWPACYGMLGAAPAPEPDLASSAYARILAESEAPLAFAQPLHRLVASVLGLSILGLFLLSLRARRYRLVCSALLGLTVFLALLGLRSGSLHDPAIVMGNLLGGFAMLGLLGWQVFSSTPVSEVPPPATVPTGVRSLLFIALLMLGGQITLGGFTSANFAALACVTLPDCHGSWWPGSELRTALNLRREVQMSPDGVVQGGPERAAIHKAHRLGALVSGCLILAALLAALRVRRLRAVASCGLALLVAEIGIGIATVLNGLPISLAVAHNWLAGLLLLVLLKLLAACQPP